MVSPIDLNVGCTNADTDTELMRSVSINFVSIPFNNNNDVDTFHVHQLYFYCNNNADADTFHLYYFCFYCSKYSYDDISSILY